MELRFKRIRKSVGGLIFAEIFALIAAVMAGGLTVLSAWSSETMIAVLAVVSIIMFGLSVISFLIILIAAIMMSKCTALAKEALVAAIIGLLLAAGGGALAVVLPVSEAGILISSLLTTATGILETFIMIFICEGESILLRSIDQGKLASKGARTGFCSAILYAFGKLGALSVLSLKNTAQIDDMIVIGVAAASIVIDVLALCIYLSYLRKAKNAFEDARQLGDTPASASCEENDPQMPPAPSFEDAPQMPPAPSFEDVPQMPPAPSFEDAPQISSEPHGTAEGQNSGVPKQEQSAAGGFLNRFVRSRSE